MKSKCDERITINDLVKLVELMDKQILVPPEYTYSGSLYIYLKIHKSNVNVPYKFKIYRLIIAYIKKRIGMSGYIGISQGVKCYVN